MSSKDWRTWHDGYDEPDSALSRRLATVREQIEIALDTAPPGLLRVLSLCAGQGRDLLPVLALHPRRDVVARLVEFNPAIADDARASVAASNLTRVEVVTGDAALTDHYLDLAPAHLVIACGIFGNIPESDIKNTIDHCSALTATGGTVLWTRHRRSPDLVPQIERWFAEAGFTGLFVSKPELDYCVGTHRQDKQPTPLPPGEKLFTFTR